jgi:hypothetical protein
MARSMSAQEMYDHLARAFEAARPPACKTCRLPKTFWGPAAGPGASGYWYMETPHRCANGCHEVLARLWAQLTTDYIIAPPPRPIIPRMAYTR